MKGPRNASGTRQYINTHKKNCQWFSHLSVNMKLIWK